MEKNNPTERLDKLTLAYISARYNIAEMDVTEYWEIFKKTFDQLSELYRDSH